MLSESYQRQLLLLIRHGRQVVEARMQIGPVVLSLSIQNSFALSKRSSREVHYLLDAVVGRQRPYPSTTTYPTVIAMKMTVRTSEMGLPRRKMTICATVLTAQKPARPANKTRPSVW